MTVIIAKDIPPRARGLMKRWFAEPKPGVFVGTLNPRVHKNVLKYISEQCQGQTQMLIISSDATCQGYRVEHMGFEGGGGGRMIDLDGIHLIAKLNDTSCSDPF
jgi:CRISPR-associated endoribonuclease Cas2 subtype I-E